MTNDAGSDSDLKVRIRIDSSQLAQDIKVTQDLIKDTFGTPQLFGNIGAGGGGGQPGLAGVLGDGGGAPGAPGGGGGIHIPITGQVIQIQAGQGAQVGNVIAGQAGGVAQGVTLNVEGNVGIYNQGQVLPPQIRTWKTDKWVKWIRAAINTRQGSIGLLNEPELETMGRVIDTIESQGNDRTIADLERSSPLFSPILKLTDNVTRGGITGSRYQGLITGISESVQGLMRGEMWTGDIPEGILDPNNPGIGAMRGRSIHFGMSQALQSIFAEVTGKPYVLESRIEGSRKRLDIFSELGRHMNLMEVKSGRPDLGDAQQVANYFFDKFEVFRDKWGVDPTPEELKMSVMGIGKPTTGFYDELSKILTRKMNDIQGTRDAAGQANLQRLFGQQESFKIFDMSDLLFKFMEKLALASTPAEAQDIIQDSINRPEGVEFMVKMVGRQAALVYYDIHAEDADRDKIMEQIGLMPEPDVAGANPITNQKFISKSGLPKRPKKQAELILQGIKNFMMAGGDASKAPSWEKSEISDILSQVAGIGQVDLMSTFLKLGQAGPRSLQMRQQTRSEIDDDTFKAFYTLIEKEPQKLEDFLNVFGASKTAPFVNNPDIIEEMRLRASGKAGGLTSENISKTIGERIVGLGMTAQQQILQQVGTGPAPSIDPELLQLGQRKIFGIILEQASDLGARGLARVEDLFGRTGMSLSELFFNKPERPGEPKKFRPATSRVVDGRVRSALNYWIDDKNFPLDESVLNKLNDYIDAGGDLEDLGMSSDDAGLLVVLVGHYERFTLGMGISQYGNAMGVSFDMEDPYGKGGIFSQYRDYMSDVLNLETTAGVAGVATKMVGVESRLRSVFTKTGNMQTLQEMFRKIISPNAASAATPSITNIIEFFKDADKMNSILEGDEEKLDQLTDAVSKMLSGGGYGNQQNRPGMFKQFVEDLRDLEERYLNIVIGTDIGVWQMDLTVWE